MFYRRLRSLRDGFAMALLTHTHSGRELLVSGLQLYGNPNWPDARIAQIHVMCETISSFLERQSRPQWTPIILLGDFASFWRKWTPDSTDKVHSYVFLDVIIQSSGSKLDSSLLGFIPC